MRILNFQNFLLESEKENIDDDKIVTDGQYAICYALSSNDKAGPGHIIKPSWDNDLDLPIKEEWYLHAGMNPVTMNRMLRQYNLLLTGHTESTPSQVLHPRIIKFFDRCQSIGKEKVIEEAKKALDEAPEVADVRKEREKSKTVAGANKSLLNKSYVELKRSMGEEKAAKIMGAKYGMAPKEFINWLNKE